MLTVGPAPAAEALRKALAMGATEAYHVVDPAIAGSDLRATLDDPRGRLPEVSSTTSSSRAPTRRTARPACWQPRSPRASDSRTSRTRPRSSRSGPGSVRVRRLTAEGYDVLEAPLPALVMGTQVLGAPRYPTLRGIMAARSKAPTTLDARRPRHRPGDRREAARRHRGPRRRAVPPARAAATIVRDTPAVAVERIVALLDERGIL